MDKHRDFLDYLPPILVHVVIEWPLRKTPLHWAAENGNLALCKLIVTNVEEKNPQDIYQNTPLHYAAKSGHLEVSDTKELVQFLNW